MAIHENISLAYISVLEDILDHPDFIIEDVKKEEPKQEEAKKEEPKAAPTKAKKPDGKNQKK